MAERACCSWAGHAKCECGTSFNVSLAWSCQAQCAHVGPLAHMHALIENCCAETSEPPSDSRWHYLRLVQIMTEELTVHDPTPMDAAALRPTRPVFMQVPLACLCTCRPAPSQ